MRYCRHYCDDQCMRPAGHEGPCYANGMIWRDATDEEERQFEEEAKKMASHG